MGFDIHVQLCLMMCSDRGTPYYYHYDREKRLMERIYEIPSFEIPHELRKYLVGRGYLFHAYTQYFDDNDMGFVISADIFLDHYPTWEEVKEHEYFADNIDIDFWNEEDHNGFKKLLEWCAAQEFSFQVSWSY